MGEPVLAFEDVELFRGRRRVLAGVSLVVRAGEAWCLVGRNGAGKSTLMLAALGTLRPRRGTVRRAPGLADRSEVGYVPQRCTLDPTLPTTVAEFIELGLVGLGLRRAEQRARVGEALADVGLDGHARRDFWEHSEGQRQRILLARALARQPRYLLMDEPTASLDPAAARRFWTLAARLRVDHGLTLLCATHDLDAVAQVATHAAICTPGPDAGRVDARPAADAADALRRAFSPPPEEHG